MEKLKLYIVTKSSTDKTFKSGDLIWMSQNGDINNAMAGGWLSADDQNSVRMDFEMEECNTHRLVVGNRSEFIVKI